MDPQTQIFTSMYFLTHSSHFSSLMGCILYKNLVIRKICRFLAKIDRFSPCISKNGPWIQIFTFLYFLIHSCRFGNPWVTLWGVFYEKNWVIRKICIRVAKIGRFLAKISQNGPVGPIFSHFCISLPSVAVLVHSWDVFHETIG